MPASDTQWLTSTTTSFDVFGAWTNTSNATYTSSTTTQFDVLFFNGSTTASSSTTWAAPKREPTEEERARVKRQVALRRQLRRSRDRREEMAAGRAERLLVGHLSPEQAEEWAARGEFVAVCPRSRRRFKVRRQWSGNLDELDAEGRRIARFCVHHRVHTPTEDNMLSQKLYIESGALDQLLAIANRHS